MLALAAGVAACDRSDPGCEQLAAPSDGGFEFRGGGLSGSAAAASLGVRTETRPAGSVQVVPWATADSLAL